MNKCTNKSKKKEENYEHRKIWRIYFTVPIFEYCILDTKDITIQERVRSAKKNANVMIAFGLSLQWNPAEVDVKNKKLSSGCFLSSEAVSDIMNMEEMLSTRRGHTKMTWLQSGKYLNKEGYEPWYPVYRILWYLWKMCL